MSNEKIQSAEVDTAANVSSEENAAPAPCLKRAVSLEAFIFIAGLGLFFGGVGSVMGGVNMMNTLMNTAYQLLMDTVFYIMGIAVLAGAVSGLMSEFGVVALINKALSPLMKPIYGLPGAATIGVVTCYLSDNPAILTLASDEGFRKYFKKYQLPALTNIGTCFGMGLIVTTFMMGIPAPEGENFVVAALVGNLGAICGSIVSTRLMLMQTKKVYGTEAWCVEGTENDSVGMNYRVVRSGGAGNRFISAMLDGGKVGVDMGMAIIPGVLIICTLVLMITNGPSASGVYTGAAYEGVPILPWIGGKISFIIKPLFNFSSAEAIAVPVTALGAAGAAIGLVPKMVAAGVAHANDVAVFTAMCMCWSGYLSTHVAMMDGLKCPHLTGKAIASHTVGGIAAGVSANIIFRLVTMF